ncbi:helix-turn-helix domain-containing protein [Cutibacterium avidum]|uniref:helix-turn-helix domain-containing protein n=1 Tax=Cutibacterium avidum TaxID=33010 RepID=UPI0022E31830|nr:helix-turn-helix domain-containing protein [Cutibacterium avidum]MDK7360181.1 helix-turn-helix domain-containing protein [Cutibacterium avidum]MDK7373905.1 helix-turn-helix domain-containing protein [Cutibacterium avidum]MDU3219488.1 helix-turn-helix domain-containing protein [Cutibacterium avidum]
MSTAGCTPARRAGSTEDSPRQSEWVTYSEAVEITSLSQRTLRRLTDQGHLPAYCPRGARALRLKRSDVMALMERVA